VAKARGLPAAAVRALVAANIDQPEFGFLGSSYINLLQLNEALARMR
jgi:K+-transporting ATPase c subunit